MTNRCKLCNKKIGLLIFKCNYCTNHRIIEDNNCKAIDIAKKKYKEELQKKLTEESSKETRIISI